MFNVNLHNKNFCLTNGVKKLCLARIKSPKQNNNVHTQCFILAQKRIVEKHIIALVQHSVYRPT